MKTRQRPKWARNLPERLWKHLCEMQNRSTPTLRQLRADREHQRSFAERAGKPCVWACQECREAARLAGIE